MDLRFQFWGQANLRSASMALSPSPLGRQIGRVAPGRSSPPSLPVKAALSRQSHDTSRVLSTNSTSRGSRLVARAAVVEAEFSNLEQPEPTKATGEESKKEKEQFVWQQTWYPICESSAPCSLSMHDVSAGP